MKPGSPTSQPVTAATESNLPPAVAAALQHAGLTGAGGFRAEPMTGGISSDIHLVRPVGQPAFVIKQALARLRVKADWRVDTRRNRTEHRWLREVAAIAPGCVPQVLLVDDAAGFFAMELVANSVAWKQQLLEGKTDSATATTVGQILGKIHGASQADNRLREAFSTYDLFHALRVEPYLIATGLAHQSLRAHFEAGADRLSKASTCLVHGDYSPKNILVAPGRTVVVDAEVGWFGDPAFDLAFMLNHLHLKALLPSPREPATYLRLVDHFLKAYARAAARLWDAELESWTTKLLLMLMLARVDGKSPLEYLSAPQQDLVRQFVSTHLPAAPTRIAQLTSLWRDFLKANAHR